MTIACPRTADSKRHSHAADGANCPIRKKTMTSTKLTCITVVLLVVALAMPASLAAQQSICSGCATAIVGTAIGVGAAIGVGIYFVHRSHTSLAGCVQQAGAGLSLIAKNGQSYELVNAPSEVQPRRRFSLRGHKIKAASGRAFRVDRVSHDYGGCTP